MTEHLYMCQVAPDWLWSHTLLLPDHAVNLSPIMSVWLPISHVAYVCVCVCASLQASLIHYWAAPDVLLAVTAPVSGTPCSLNQTEPGSSSRVFDLLPRLLSSTLNSFVSSECCLSAGRFPRCLLSYIFHSIFDGTGKLEMHSDIFLGVTSGGGMVLLSSVCFFS